MLAKGAEMGSPGAWHAVPDSALTSPARSEELGADDDCRQ